MTQKPYKIIPEVWNPPPIFAQGGPLTATYHNSNVNISKNAAPAAYTHMGVVKPIRLVYEQDGHRYHLLLGEGGELPLPVSMGVQEIYTLQHHPELFFNSAPKILKEFEITLKLRVKNYTTKKIETE